ncbi:hypothetical protein [Hydrogenimonas cancrithermarum]|uniref:Uncharacterized protein n=1 Tax=Hydrogenimonas cancrithermarum TaxID=2993563 RepID=A0ABN6WXG4_9BACT|nr:hypothetical protein [Hydrogenimonas cancrithermarum]BDY14001.1 hypothetical protein HCR_23140 [Hydrogenimonas cancrithermarum]
MLVDELIAKVKEAEKKRTPKQSRELLIKARILDKNGYYDARYFRKETVEKSKKQAVAS